MRLSLRRLFVVILPMLLSAAIISPVAAQDVPVPYWASIRSDEVNMRVGPSEDYRIAWVYHRELLPLKVLRLKEGWRLVRDPAGEEGWILSRFLSRKRTAIVSGKGLADMRAAGDPLAQLMWRLEPGVVGLLGRCDAGWCRFDVGPRGGFVAQDRLWGSGEP